MSENVDVVVEFATLHLAELGLPKDFAERLLSDDDWSFVIKLHALVEAAMTNALVAHTGEETTREIFARLELSNLRTGKLAFAKALDCAFDEDRRFVHALSELRNTLVHDVRNVTFNLGDHVSSLSQEDRRRFARDLCYACADIEGKSGPIDDGTVANTLQFAKKALWRSGLYVVAVLFLKLELTRVKRETTSNKARVAELARAANRNESQKTLRP